MVRHIAAVDIGAGSGRVMVGHYDGQEICMEEMHRFEHEIINVGGILFWDLLFIWKEVKKGILKAARKYGKLDSIGIDAFAPDFCFMSKNTELLGQARSYRNYTDGAARRRVMEKVSEERFLEITGNAFIDIALLPQLQSMQDICGALSKLGAYLLPVPNALNVFLGGRPCTDFTQASISMLYDWKKKGWSKELMNIFGINESLLPEVEQSPKVIGRCTLPGLEETQIINIGSHDTAVANDLLSQLEENAICLNTGTWTSVGIRSKEPLGVSEAIKTGLSSFGLPDGSFILCKNVVGTWFLRELKQCWEGRGVFYSFQEMGELAKKAGPVKASFDLLQPRYLDAIGTLLDVMREDIRKEIGTEPLEGQIIRKVYDFIVDIYHQTILELERLKGKQFSAIVLGGGAARDCFLCDYIAQKCGKGVVKAPAEAASLGNIILQLEAIGDIASKERKREVIKLFVERG